jgi:enamine deaminase RidA (YjgF/YER057c/UK114 family)
VQVEKILASKGLILPPPATPPPGFAFPFEFVRIRDNRAFVSGYMAQAPDGSLPGPFGKVPSVVPLPAAQESARSTALSMLGSLHRALGDLDRISAWLMVNGLVNADPGFPETTLVLNAFSELILDVFGPEVGAHARTAIGVTALPLDTCVVIAAELEVVAD